jgi:SAM-dependent methyltransferase
MLHTLTGTLRHWFNLLTYSWKAIGPRRILQRLLPYSTDAEARNVDSGFDARYGTETNAGVTPDEAGIPPPRVRGATMYLPSMDGDLDAMLDALAWSRALLEQATFVDIGSGKGRAVFLAAMRPFREAVGLELSPMLHETAERNLAKMQSSGALRAPVRLCLGDATAVHVPRGPLIVYLYHPFREPVAAKVVDRIVASIAASPRPAAILYGHPTLQRCLDPDVFARGGVFRYAHQGVRTTRRFQIGWSVWTNDAWLDDARSYARTEDVMPRLVMRSSH